jgi:hypothetical protein
LRFASLASGSSGNCLVAEAAGTVVLVDCGSRLLKRSGGWRGSGSAVAVAPS